MGCRVEETESEREEYSRNEKLKVSKRIAKYKKEADLVTSFLCAVGNVLTKEQLKKLPKEYVQWKTEHEAWDKKRVILDKKKQKEKEQREALEKKEKLAKAKKYLKKAKDKIKSLS